MRRGFVLVSLLAAACGGGPAPAKPVAIGQECIGLRVCEERCRGGEALSCVFAGDAHLVGDETARDLAPARALFNRACAAGEALGCSRWADGADGDDRRRSHQRAAELADRGCQAGSARDCTTAAELTRTRSDGDPVKARERAGELYERACKLGDPDGCLGAGTTIEAAAGAGGANVELALFALAMERAEVFYGRACDLGRGPACALMATREMDPAPALALARRGVDLLDKDCRRGRQWSCVLAAAILHKQIGGVTDPSRATALFDPAHAYYERECRAGHPAGCGSLADIHGQGYGVDVDADLAARHAARACTLGLKTHCTADPVVIDAGEQPKGRACPAIAVPEALRADARQAATATAGTIAGVVRGGHDCELAAGVTAVVTGPDLHGGMTAITDENGGFVIRDVPPGRYQLTLYYGDETSETPVTVTAGAATEVVAQVPAGP